MLNQASTRFSQEAPVAVECRCTRGCAASQVWAAGFNLTSTGAYRTFVLSHGSSHLEIPPAIDVEESLRRTRKFWSDWSDRCGYDGRYADIVKRSYSS